MKRRWKTAPDHQLGIALGSNTSQTARMLGALEPLLTDEQPDAVLVYGDTNSTLAGALAGAAFVPAVTGAGAAAVAFGSCQ